MLDLCIHCGGKHASRDEIENVETPQPTDSWVPVPHHRLRRQVETSLEGYGLRVVNEAHALWNDGARYFGLMEVANGSEHDDYGLVIGLRNSHDKSFPAAIGLGNAVFVCDNLAFCAEVKIARRHTKFIERDLPAVVSNAVGRLSEMRATQDQRIAAYKETELDDRSVHDLVIRSIDARVVPVTQVPHVLAEWREPRHEEFSAAGPTAWRAFNAFTEVLKGRNLAALPGRTQALHGLFDAACEIRGLPAPANN